MQDKTAGIRCLTAMTHLHPRILELPHGTLLGLYHRRACRKIPVPTHPIRLGLHQLVLYFSTGMYLGRSPRALLRMIVPTGSSRKGESDPLRIWDNRQRQQVGKALREERQPDDGRSRGSLRLKPKEKSRSYGVIPQAHDDLTLCFLGKCR